METNKNFQPVDLKTILINHEEIAEEITQDIKILQLFQLYLHHGYYPFYLQGINEYNMKLENVINTILDVDLPYELEITVHNIFKIKKLLHILTSSVPFSPNISKLAGSLELNRNTLTNYLKYLDDAKLISLLLDAGKSYGSLSKAEKIYIQNTNMCFTLESKDPNRGSLREIFFFNQLSAKHKVSYSDKGDFLIDEKYIFEIGGSGKGCYQIINSENSYLALDEMQKGIRYKILLWLFGFIY